MVIDATTTPPQTNELGLPTAPALADHPRGGPVEPLVETAPNPSLSVCVVIPARDEASRLPAAIATLAHQADRHGRPIDPETYEVIVLANNCRDATAAVARAAAVGIPALAVHIVERTLPPEAAHVGTARRLLMDEAAWRLHRVGCPRGIIASTDADSIVAPDWLAANAGEIARGADAVGGRLLAGSAGDEPLDPATRAYHLRHTAYLLLVAELVARVDPDPGDPLPRHHQHFGASFAITAEAYLRVGGLPSVPALEDLALVSALWRMDARIRHSPAVRVETSSRRAGRVPVGFSTQLGEWDALAATGAPFLVEAPAAIEDRLRLRRLLRRAWADARAGQARRRQDVPGLAERLGVGAAWLAGELDAAPHFGALWDALLKGLPAPLQTEVAAAVLVLRLRLAELRRGAPLPPLEQVEPVGLLPSTAQAPQRSALRRRRQEALVDLVAGEGVVVDERRPVHQQQVAAGVERGEDLVARRRQIGARPVVAHLGDEDEVEPLGGELGRYDHPLETGLGQVATARPGHLQRRLHDIDRQQAAAAGGQALGEDTTRATDLEGAGIARPG